MTIDEPDPGCPSTTRHGTAHAYDHRGCRCPDARRASTAARAARGGRTPQPAAADTADPVGPWRRIRALHAIGWTRNRLAVELGPGHARILNQRPEQPTTAATAARVADVYERLAGTRGDSTATAARAAGRGWAPPIAWDDADIDDPAAQPWGDDDSAESDGVDTEPDPVAVSRLFGDDPPPSPLAAIDALAFTAAATEAGWSAARIGARVGVSARQVCRWRRLARAGVPALRDCEGCGRPIPYDMSEQPWRYLQRRFHPGACLQARRDETRAAANRVRAAGQGQSRLGVAS